MINRSLYYVAGSGVDVAKLGHFSPHESHDGGAHTGIDQLVGSTAGKESLRIMSKSTHWFLGELPMQSPQKQEVELAQT
jgi:hypothetical protein